MSKNENNAAPPWTIEFLRITDYHMNSEISINASGTGYDSYTNLFLTGAVTLPYTINAVQIKFVPDDQPLSKPSWQHPCDSLSNQSLIRPLLLFQSVPGVLFLFH